MIPAVLFTLVLSFLLACLTWLVIGSRFGLIRSQAENDVLNLLSYLLLLVPLSFVIDFVVIGGIVLTLNDVDPYRSKFGERFSVRRRG